MFGHPTTPVKKTDDARPWRPASGRRSWTTRGLLLGAVAVLALVALAAVSGLTGGGELGGASAAEGGESAAASGTAGRGGAAVRPPLGLSGGRRQVDPLAVPAGGDAGHATSVTVGANGTAAAAPARRSHKDPAAPPKAAPARVWVTEELEEYASLITAEVEQAWKTLEEHAGDATSSLVTAEQSEFYSALTMLSLNVTTVCELGVGDGRLAITWLEALPWTRVYSFGRPLTPAESSSAQGDGSFAPSPALEPTAADRATTAQQARTRAYLKRTYRGRFTWLPLNKAVSAAEIQRVAAEQSISKCDVIVISTSSWAESSAPVRRDDPALLNKPLPQLKVELSAMRQLTRGWHFLIMDGMGCSGKAAAKAAVTDAAGAGDEDAAGATAAANAGSAAAALRGPKDELMPAGTVGDCPNAAGTGAAGWRRTLALPPQRVRATWESVVSEGSVVEYECRTGEWHPPGWCLGTYRRAAYSSAGPGGGGSWLNRAAGTTVGGGTGASRVLPWLSSEGTYLNVGDQLWSRGDAFYLSMQEDGNLVIYRNEKDPSTGESEGKAVWSSRTSGSVGAYFLALQPDSNLAVFPGTSGTQEGEVLWSTKSRPVQGSFYLEIQDDGKLAIYRGESPEHNLGLLRRMRPRYVPKHDGS